MRGMIWLHQNGVPILVNPAQIQTVHPRTAGKGPEKSYVYLVGEEDPILTDEDLNDIDRKIALS